MVNIDYYSQEYGSQDFFGAIDELRIWRTVRTEEQINLVDPLALAIALLLAFPLLI